MIKSFILYTLLLLITACVSSTDLPNSDTKPRQNQDRVISKPGVEQARERIQNNQNKDKQKNTSRPPVQSSRKPNLWPTIKIG